jgi:hypothetical protein
MKSGAVCGGQTWIMSNSTSTVCGSVSGSFTSNQAFFAGPSTATRLWKKFSVRVVAVSCSPSARDVVLDAEQHAAGVHELDVDVVSTPARCQWSPERYIAFCGAPAHLIGIGGWVKIARPSFRPCTSSQV